MRRPTLTSPTGRVSVGVVSDSASVCGRARSRQNFRLSLVEPWFLGRKLSLGTELYYRDLLFLSPEFDQTNVGASVFLRKPVGRKAYVKAEYRIENIEVNAEEETSQAFKDEEGDFLRSAVTLNYVYDSRDSNICLAEGHKIDLGLTYAGGFLGGDIDTYTFSAAGTQALEPALRYHPDRP